MDSVAVVGARPGAACANWPTAAYTSPKTASGAWPTRQRRLAWAGREETDAPREDPCCSAGSARNSTFAVATAAKRGQQRGHVLQHWRAPAPTLFIHCSACRAALLIVNMLRAFIVEDSPVIRENLVATLEEMVPLKVLGYADTERAALDWLDDPAHDCDLIIVDLFLRHGSGLHVLEHLCRIGRTAERVVLTNYATADVRRRCIRLGASRVFDKSGEIDALIEHCLMLADQRGSATPDAAV